MAKAPRQVYVVTRNIEEYIDSKRDVCAIGAAFAQACHAHAISRQVHIFLEANAVSWAFKSYKPSAETGCFNPSDYFQQCLEDGIDISACRTCISCSSMYCHLNEPTQDISELIYPGIKIGSFTDLQDLLDEPCNIFTF